MLKKTLLLVAISIAACGMASASLLVVTASGQFAGSDVADPLVTPNGIFSLSFDVLSSPTVANVSSLGFDVSLATFFSYKLNNVAISVAPSEIRFNTLANGGLFDVTIGSGLSAEEFDFQGVQAFSGTTSAPVIATGNYTVTGWTYSDPANYDPETAGTVSVSPAPEPSTILLLSCGFLALFGRSLRVLEPKQ